MNFRISLTTVIAIYCFSAVDFCSGQSTVIGHEQPNSSFSLKTPARDYSVPNSLSSQHRHWDAILDRPATGLLNRIDFCEELVTRLRKLGLPVFLDQTAMDDYLTLDEAIDIGYDGVSLRAVLFQTLSERNASIVFKDNRMLIISRDYETDSEYLQSIVYDVSSIAGTFNELESLVATVKTIDEGSWNDSQGAGSATYQRIGGRSLVTINQNYRVHRDIQKWLRSLNKMKGRSLPVETNLSGVRAGSTVVNSQSQFGILKPEVGRGMTGGGIGGFGGGGGVF